MSADFQRPFVVDCPCHGWRYRLYTSEERARFIDHLLSNWPEVDDE